MLVRKHPLIIMIRILQRLYSLMDLNMTSVRRHLMYIVCRKMFYLDLLAGSGNVITANNSYFPPQQNFGAQEQQSTDKNNTLQQPTAVMVRKHIDYVYTHPNFRVCARRKVPAKGFKICHILYKHKNPKLLFPFFILCNFFFYLNIRVIR